MTVYYPSLDTLCDRFISKHFSGVVGSGIAKLPEEFEEFKKDPSVDEAADVFLCLLIELRQRGHSLDRLLYVAHKKAQINLDRAWVKQLDGTIHHI